ncbi:asparagine synthase (glutamine-hydrolyzing) [Kibdelosporangium banguiense]|uniref:asparagine synthase (glutamine-hydrolyzing) n=1 Tax=Kibdelosporangium banguiense TaxID=1365924 RepID=A0ABS4TNH6_9PSEU|nr:asparagine synthase (glutamine-hydrolyzing) [Kibdelosporangium banguiense]MBP2325451.1 asparagine synthase (glutamine-hydrolyzing) [Kibdelosporangium banguiense]
MCGIAGWVAFETDLTIRSQTVDAMTATMGCRGPDDSGTWIRAHAGLGHRRLAIIDLPGGRQPMSVPTPSGEVAMVYSGETYNFQDLREELLRKGHKFVTVSDTEVVLRGYLEWGDAVAERLNGMFALAVWDERVNKLVMIRDRLGVKPLHYYPTRDGVLFGSEPKAILANPLARKVVDLDGLRELVGFTVAPKWSLWKDMYEVEPGTIVTVDRDGIRQRRYWSLRPAEHQDDLDTTIDRIRELMTDIVHRQLVSDVPRCVLLSGGLDSSAVTGLAAARLASLGEQLRTFSVDFVGREETFTADENWDSPDTPFIRDVTDLVGSTHQFIMLKPGDLTNPDLRRAVITARDMPVGFGETDTSLYLMFEAIRQESTVALSGESADEVFGGYRWMHDPVAVNAKTFPWLAYRSPMSGDRAAFLAPHIRARLELDSYVDDQYATAVAAVEHRDSDNEWQKTMRVNQNLHLTRFVRMLLDRKDRISMAVGLEVRVPFCDHRLIEYLYSTPWSMKTFDGREKSLLRAATAHVLPESVLGRRKSPYPSTQDPGYALSLQQQAKEVIADRGHPVHDLLDQDWLAGIVQQDVAKPSDARRGIDRVLDMYHWLDLYRPDLRF